MSFALTNTFLFLSHSCFLSLLCFFLSLFTLILAFSLYSHSFLSSFPVWSSFVYLSFSSTSSVWLFLSSSLFLNCLPSFTFYSFTLFILSFSRVGHYTHNISITNNRNKITHNINIHIWISLKTFPVFPSFPSFTFSEKIIFRKCQFVVV